jgi:FkbM family methyltransferase
MFAIMRWYLRTIPFEKGKHRLRAALKKHYSSGKHRVKTLYGARMWIGLDDGAQQSLLYTGKYEEDLVVCFRSLLTQGDIVIDMGANIGYFTMLAARMVGNKGRVIAFEPTPYNAERLKEHFALNRITTPMDLEVAGLSDADGELAMNMGKSSNQMLNSFAETRFEADPVIVPVYRLDRYMERRGIDRIDFVKIDVQDWEYQVLAGCKGVLEDSNRPWMAVEFQANTLYRRPVPMIQAVRLLADYGYVLYWVEPHGRFTRLPASLPLRGNNLLLTIPERVAELGDLPETMTLAQMTALRRADARRFKSGAS